MESSTTLRPIGRRAGEGGRDGGSLALLWVGRFDRNKDPLTVVRGFAMFAERCKTATLTCVYRGGDLEPDVRAEISRHPELASRVRLVGEVPHAELPRHHAAADVFVLGSRYEGSGYAAIEALACGSIPALTDIPPFRALTDEGRVGTLWTAGDPASLRDALERIAARPLERERRAARALFEARFSWAAIGTRALAIYREAVDVRRTAPAGTP